MDYLSVHNIRKLYYDYIECDGASLKAQIRDELLSYYRSIYDSEQEPLFQREEVNEILRSLLRNIQLYTEQIIKNTYDEISYRKMKVCCQYLLNYSNLSYISNTYNNTPGIIEFLYKRDEGFSFLPERDEDSFKKLIQPFIDYLYEFRNIISKTIKDNPNNTDTIADLITFLVPLLAGHFMGLKIEVIVGVLLIIFKNGLLGFINRDDKNSVPRIEGTKSRRPNMDLLEMGLKEGDNLIWKKKKNIKVEVCDKNTVIYENIKYNIRELTGFLKGTNKRSDPRPCWLFEDKTLGDIYDEKYKNYIQ